MVDASGVPAGANAGNNLLPTSSATAAITNGPNTIINTNSSISNAANVNSGGGGGGGGPGGMKPSAGTHEACIPPLLGVAPLGTSKLQKEHQIQVILMGMIILFCGTLVADEHLFSFASSNSWKPPTIICQHQAIQRG